MGPRFCKRGNSTSQRGRSYHNFPCPEAVWWGNQPIPSAFHTLFCSGCPCPASIPATAPGHAHGWLARLRAPLSSTTKANCEHCACVNRPPRRSQHQGAKRFIRLLTCLRRSTRLTESAGRDGRWRVFFLHLPHPADPTGRRALGLQYA